eukprot:TRINITY_DN2693_c0_g1_i2.p1 TRINITY_DN2693_c0_g1~~TRINITY_DN2693_c0_g1_i2.p1  ORF type:complete len:487 (-),score=82.86 TRINITY_DN2693_c0_g1_i2:168-1628(-)
MSQPAILSKNVGHSVSRIQGVRLLTGTLMRSLGIQVPANCGCMTPAGFSRLTNLDSAKQLGGASTARRSTLMNVLLVSKAKASQCRPTGCSKGQGGVYLAYSTTSDNSFEGCGTLCDKDSDCVAFDYTEQASSHVELHTLTFAKKDACRLYKVDEPETDHFYDDCGKLCLNDTECVAFDYSEKNSSHLELHTLTLSKKDSCRLYAVDKPREGSSHDGPAHRSYCRKLNAMTTTTESLTPEASKTAAMDIPEEPPAGVAMLEAGKDEAVEATVEEVPPETLPLSFDCQDGEGEAWKTYHETADNSFEGCGAHCLSDPRCEAFDWNSDKTSGHPSLNISKLWVYNACRLFEANKPRLGRTQWGRQYCQKKVIVPLDEKFRCSKGQGGVYLAYSTTSDNSFEGCGTLCDTDSACVAFDYTEQASSHVELHTLTFAKKDACRLYKVDEPREGSFHDGPAHRSYCRKLSAMAIDSTTSTALLNSTPEDTEE